MKDTQEFKNKALLVLNEVNTIDEFIIKMNEDGKKLQREIQTP